MLFCRTLVPVIWISSLAAAAPAQTTQLADSSVQGVPKGPELEASKPALDVNLPSKPSGDARTDTKASARAPGAANPVANVAEKTGNASAGATTNVAAPAQTTPPTPKDQAAIRRDPAGRKGVSPFWEAIRRGDEAALARDLARAEVAYQAAMVIESENPIASLRLGQISVRSSKLDQAEIAYQDALRRSSMDATLHAAALFGLADLRERQGQRDEAIAAWQAYEDYLKKHSNAKGYPETPVERASRIRKYVALTAECKAVRERIDLRIKEVDEASRRKTANNPNANR